jgi:capsular exopolysaccharide synthesis family protein
MSRLEEALRRSRATALEELPRPEPPQAAAPPQMALQPDTLREPDPAPQPESVIDAFDFLGAGQDTGIQDAVAPPLSEEPRVEAAPLEPRDPRVDTMRETPKRPDRGRRSENSKLILDADMPPGVVEQYRKVAASLHQLQLDRGTKIVMIASAMAGDGKTITASNVALTLSESFRRRVLLVDADLRRPSIHVMFDTPNVTGLNEALTSETEQKLTIFEVTPRLSVLPSGRPNPDPMSSLCSDRMRMIVAEAATKFDWVVIDTPPVGVLADARLLAEIVDAVVLVIGAGRTPFRAVERAIEAIDRKRIAGVVLNRVTERHAAYQYYDYDTSSDRG